MEKERFMFSILFKYKLCNLAIQKAHTTPAYASNVINDGLSEPDAKKLPEVDQHGIRNVC